MTEDRGYVKRISNNLQPLSLKPIPEDDPYTPGTDGTGSFASIVELVMTKTEGESGPKYMPKRLRKYAGIILTLIASLFFSSGVLIVKILNGPEYQMSTFSSSFWRYLGIMLPAIPLLLYAETKQKVKGKGSIFNTVYPLNRNNQEKWWTILGLLSRGILGGASVILRYFSLEYLTIGDTAVITYATPVLVTVMAHFCLGEKMGYISVLVGVLTFVGVIIMTRPPFITGQETFDTNILIGTALACCSLVCASLIVIITRKIRNVHFSLMTLVFGTIGTLQALVLTLIFQSFAVPSGLIDTSFVLALMILSFLAQMAIILALKFEQAGPVSLVRSCDVLFGFFFQYVFLSVVPDALSAIGGLVVLSCVTLTGIRKWVSTLPEDSPNRTRFKFLLY